MCEDDNARSRVEYLIASMIEAQADCGIRREFGTCAVFDNLIRIAEDVKLSLPNVEPRHPERRQPLGIAYGDLFDDHSGLA